MFSNRRAGRPTRASASFCVGILSSALASTSLAQSPSLARASEPEVRSFLVQGLVMELPDDRRTVVVSHEAVTGYMAAMTMPFNVRNARELANLRPGDHVSFWLHVGDAESWIDQITATERVLRADDTPPAPASPQPRTAKPRHPLLGYKFTSELGQPVSLNDFHGQALAITFFFTRCPVPDFCPRLSRNFQAASQKLLALPNAPTNWHFLSFSFDTEFDTPAVLKAYAEHYRYDSRHWTFLTGPADKLAELAAESDVTFARDSGFFSHNFRTLVVDAAGHLQMAFPIGGDLSEALVAEILKAAAVTNLPAR